MTEHKPKGTVERIDAGTVRRLFRGPRGRFSGRMIFRRGHQSSPSSSGTGSSSTRGPTTRAPSRRGAQGQAAGDRRPRHRQGLKLAKAKDKPLGMILLAEDDKPRTSTSAWLLRWSSWWRRGSLGFGTCYLNEGISPGAEVVPLRVAAVRLIEGRAGRAPSRGRLPPPLRAGARRSAPDACCRPAPPVAGAPSPDGERGQAVDENAFRSFLQIAESAKEGITTSCSGEAKATPEEIRDAYQDMVAPGTRPAEHRIPATDLLRLQEVFARINAAFAILGDRDKRAGTTGT